MPYPRPPRHRRRLALALAALLALVAVGASPAVAGTYTINGTCGLWDAYNDDPAHIAVYAQCPALTARNVRGNFTTPASGTGGGWRFTAPPGSGIAAAAISYLSGGHNGWQAAMYEEGAFGYMFSNCP